MAKFTTEKERVVVDGKTLVRYRNGVLFDEETHKIVKGPDHGLQGDIIRNKKLERIQKAEAAARAGIMRAVQTAERCDPAQVAMAAKGFSGAWSVANEIVASEVMLNPDEKGAARVKALEALKENAGLKPHYEKSEQAQEGAQLHLNDAVQVKMLDIMEMMLKEKYPEKFNPQVIDIEPE